MTNTHDESWDVEPAFFTNYRGTVTEAWFEAGKNNPKWTLCLKMTTDSLDRPEHTEYLGLEFGRDVTWESRDGGETVVNIQGRKKFNERSTYGKFIQKAAELGATDVIAKRGSTKDANVWLGTTWDWTIGEEREYEDGDGNKRVFRTNLPSAFVGVGDAGTNGKVENAWVEGLADDLRTELAAIAQSTPNRDAFATKAMSESAQVKADPAILKRLYEDGVYEALKG